MNRKDFKGYKAKFILATSQVLATEHTENLNEAAFPAYSNPNPLMSFLFWERLYRVIQHVEDRGHLGTVLDFGCGSGVMLPFLSRQAEKVIAIDIDLEPLRRLEKYIDFDEKICFSNSYADIPPTSLDLIIALDVLEHVEDLEKILEQLVSLLKPEGELIISGPTENFLYKIGRKLAGPEYSGEYHARDVYQIRQSLKEFAQVQTIATLFVPVPFFIIFSGRPNIRSVVNHAA